MGEQLVMVEFVMKKEAGGYNSSWEDSNLVVVGNIAQLGCWVPSSGLFMHLDSTHLWTATLNLPAGLAFEYKVVHTCASGTRFTWMSGPNRSLVVPPFAAMISVINTWEFLADFIPVTITFGTVKETDRGQQLRLVGDTAELGRWDLKHAQAMVWHVGDRWKADINVTAGSILSYKYVLVSDQTKNLTWMPGLNRVLLVPKGSVALMLLNHWTMHPAPIIPTPPPSTIQLVAVYFVLEHHCPLGQHFKVVGSTNTLGKWDTHKACKMVWHFGDIWMASMNFLAGSFIEYKLVLVREFDGAVMQWQTGLNRGFLVPTKEFEFIVKETWQNG